MVDGVSGQAVQRAVQGTSWASGRQASTGRVCVPARPEPRQPTGRFRDLDSGWGRSVRVTTRSAALASVLFISKHP